MKDFENLAWMRGPGFQLIDYEQHKENRHTLVVLPRPT